MKKEKSFLKTGQKLSTDDQSVDQHFGQIASLIGERSRAMMLWNLLDGRAYTATELAIAADVSFQSASNHLSLLLNSGLLKSEKQGRHKYYRFANDKVARAIENIAALMPTPRLTEPNTHVNSSGIKYARTCYDHLAGLVGVQLTQSLIKNKWLIAYDDRYELSGAGNKRLCSLGIDVEATQKQDRKFAYPCLDWSERNHHLGGSLGAAILSSLMEKDWIRKIKHSREVMVTGKGKKEMGKIFRMNL